MVEQKFIDRIEELRHNTYSRITDLQKNLCPMMRKVYMDYRLEYWYEGYKYTLWEDDTHIYAVKDIPYCYDNELRNTTFTDTLDNLVANEKVWPFILFIDGAAIKWSDITIIHDYDYTYMKIKNIIPDYSITVDMLVFPINGTKIRYGEDSDILTGENAGKGFYFDQNGYRIENVEYANVSIRLEIPETNIYFKVININEIEKCLEFTDLPDGYIPTFDNIITFDNDGKFVADAASNIFSDSLKSSYGLFKLTGYNKYNIKWAILMYNTRHSKSKSYIYSKSEDLHRPSVKTLLRDTNEGTPNWINLVEPVIDRFDFDHDIYTDYGTNVKNATKYITNYDYALWKEVYVKDSPIKSYTYTGKDYKALADDKGYIHLSRKHTDMIQDCAIVFVNSKLYEYSIDITYTTNTINIPIFNITDDDHVEILIFTECNNNILDILVPDNENPIYIHPSYNLDECYIMSEECADPVYSVPDNDEGRKQYVVDFIYTTTEKEGYYIINYDNDFYYGKELKIVPKKQFRHYEFKQKEDQFKIILPTQFNYCHDADRYLVFVNGLKIDRTEYTITIMNDARPFDKLVLYLSTILDEGDYVDIFYIPEVLKESYKLNSIPMAGFINLEEPNNYPKLYPFSKYTTMIFINGMKVNPLEIKDVDMNSMLINVDKYMRDEDGNIIYDGDKPKISPYYINSIYNVTIMEYLEGDPYIAGYLQGLYDQIPEGEEYDPSKIDFTKKAYDNWKKFISKIIIDHKGGTTVIEDGEVIGTVLKFFDTGGAEVDEENNALILKEVEFINADALIPLYGEIHYLEKSDPSYKEKFAGLKSILYDIIVDYYLTRAEANTGEPFTMDFERDSWLPEGNDEDIIKLITLFPDHDKLLDYITSDVIADTDAVLSGQKFIPIEQ